MMGFLKRAWKGEEKLWKVFWISVVAYLALSLLLIAINYMFVTVWMQYYPPFLDVANKAAVLIYLVWASVAIWRCAFNVNARIFSYMARACAVFLVIIVTDRMFFDGMGLYALLYVIILSSSSTGQWH